MDKETFDKRMKEAKQRIAADRAYKEEAWRQAGVKVDARGKPIVSKKPIVLGNPVFVESKWLGE